MKSTVSIYSAALLLAGSVVPALAAVSADEARQLGGDKLTQFGAEKAGNADGTIPAYGGKAPKAPAAYDKKDPGQRPDPYGDKPLFTITADNAEKYASKLHGMRELFKRYPDFKMVVYPSRRDWVYPKYVLDNSVKNATSCKAIDNELKLEGCWGGFPFPIPKTGNQVMWNHLLQYSQFNNSGVTEGTLTPPDGKYVLMARAESLQRFDNYDPKATAPFPSNGNYWLVRQNTTGPARKAGEILVLQDNLDMVGVGRRAYQYIPGQRRVKLAPNLAYDTPLPNNGGAATMDDAKGFLGALDRYDFKLVGKKEKFVMYNNYDLMNHKVCSLDKLANSKSFPNPECVRWELHRVWVVEATLKAGLRHVYQKRHFYWDEDVPGAGVAENYDAAGKLYRVSTNTVLPFYADEAMGGGVADGTFVMDLQTGAWTISGGTASAGTGWVAAQPQDMRVYSPESMSGEGVR